MLRRSQSYAKIHLFSGTSKRKRKLQSAESLLDELYNSSVSDDFAKEAKRLAKKYPSFKQDYKDFLVSIKNNPLQGDEITKNIRKIRMAIKAKGKGKSGGARVITFNILTDIENGHVVFLLLYDKEDASTVKVNVVKQLVRDMGFDLE